jgi:hypothetical protein
MSSPLAMQAAPNHKTAWNDLQTKKPFLIGAECGKAASHASNNVNTNRHGSFRFFAPGPGISVFHVERP